MKKLLKMQEQLDNYITKSKHLEDLDAKVRLTSTILALNVEVAELCKKRLVI